MNETRPREAEPRSREAKRLIEELVVQRGLSWADAVGELERRGRQVQAPYFEAAAVIREWLGGDV